MEKLSIIVPVYNAEKYISRCLDSLINQTYKNVEIIVVNDGSLDNSLRICEKYQQVDSRVKIYSQRNRGVSEARNLGLKKCQGEYIAFVDADDFISEFFAEDMVKLVQDNPCSIGICDTYINSKTDDNYTYTELFINNWTVTGKIFPKYLVENIYFDSNLKIAEDLLFLTNVFLSNGKVRLLHIKKALYFYMINKSSAMHSKKYDIKLLNSLKVEVECYKKLSEKQVDLSNSLLIFNGIYQFMSRFWQQTISEIRKNYNDYLVVKDISCKYKDVLVRCYKLNRKKGTVIFVLLKCPYIYYFFKRYRMKKK